MTREEAILAMLDGKQVTSDEFGSPDNMYCIYNSKEKYPFRLMGIGIIDMRMESVWGIKTWRLRKYQPKDKELVWCWDVDNGTRTLLAYYDAKNRCTYTTIRNRKGTAYDNYAPFDGTPPPNMCKPEDLEN